MLTYTTPLYKELIKEPHILIAGATGSGKSVCLNGIINEILVNRAGLLYLVDPKRVELSPWKKSKYCAGYADSLQDIARLIRGACREMDKRYKIMERRNLRKWDGSHIYLCIDEYIDIAPQVEKNKELRAIKARIDSDLIRLISLARAAGIHILLCTQAPYSFIISPILRANLQTRICLHTQSAAQSRVIMDRNGCESLPAYGQGYIMRPAGIELYNIPMLSDNALAAAALIR